VEVVEEGVTGSLLPVGDTEAMAAACLRLLEDPDRLRNAKEAARARALEHFSTAPVVDRYEEIYWSSIRQVLREGPVSDEMGSYSPCGNLPEADGRGGEK
jgi:hypothetical protein